jgi:hypothetical protein
VSTATENRLLPVDMSVHRIGPSTSDPGDPRRTYGPRTCQVQVMPGDNRQGLTLVGVNAAWDYVHLEFDSFGPANDDGWVGGRLGLISFDGRRIGSPRPFLLYGEPCDVPSITHFPCPYTGMWVVALRVAS